MTGVVRLCACTSATVFGWLDGRTRLSRSLHSQSSSAGLRASRTTWPGRTSSWARRPSIAGLRTRPTPCSNSRTQIAADVGSETLRALALLGRGAVARWRADPAAARGHYREALAICLAAEIPRGEARARTGIASTELDEGSVDVAAAELHRTLEIARQMGDASLIAVVREQSARAAAAVGDEAERARLLEEADMLRAQQGRPRGALEQRDVRAGSPLGLSVRSDSAAPITAPSSAISIVPVTRIDASARSTSIVTTPSTSWIRMQTTLNSRRVIFAEIASVVVRTGRSDRRS